MKKVLNKYKLEIGGGVIGATAGWCYWFFVGCASGSCLITASPVNSTIYGAVMGVLAFSLLHGRKRENSKIQE
jgi:hypothetical protein